MADVALDLADALGLTDSPAGTAVAVTGLSVMGLTDQADTVTGTTITRSPVDGMDLTDTPAVVGYDLLGVSRMRLSDSTVRSTWVQIDRTAADILGLSDTDIPTAVDVIEALDDVMTIGDRLAGLVRLPGVLTAGTRRSVLAAGTSRGPRINA